MHTFIFDTETTGLVKNSLIPLNSQPHIIEFFGHTVDSETGEVVSEIEFICDPGVILDPIITRITGIKQEDLKGKKPFRAYAEQVRNDMCAVDSLVAHNLSFDFSMVSNELNRLSIQFAPKARKICTVEQTEWMKGHRLSLGAMHEELFGEPFAGAHRARTDVMALTKCYLELWKRGEV